jgi:hypothetical protein
MIHNIKNTIRYLLISIIIYMFIYSHILCADKNSNNEIDEKKKFQNAEQLIDSLKNHNIPPKIIGDDQKYVPIFNKYYNWSEQDRIQKVIQKIINNGEQYWPILVKHLDNDDRYCMTYAYYDSANNYSIQMICEDIISDYLTEAYHQQIPNEIVYGSEQLYSHLRVPDIVYKNKLKQWCIKNKNKKLYELQIEMCVWAIKELDNVNELKNKDKILIKDNIQKEIMRLKISKKPVILKTYGRGEKIITIYNSKQAEKIREMYIKNNMWREESEKNRKRGHP